MLRSDRSRNYRFRKGVNDISTNFCFGKGGGDMDIVIVSSEHSCKAAMVNSSDLAKSIYMSFPGCSLKVHRGPQTAKVQLSCQFFA